ncbi:MAG: hypothetical protein NW207_02195 [Cytophagales bacterium]|nr:hypothetical protein [Cytophagales bacterium]
MLHITIQVAIIVVAIVLIIVLISKYKINAFYALMAASFFAAIIFMPADKVVPEIKDGLAHAFKSVGLIVIFGTAIGLILDKSGATLSIANFIVHKIGKQNTLLAILLTSFLVGLPIFCDSAFIVLIGLTKSLSQNSGTPLGASVILLATVLLTVHCLVPPHPGATAAAGILGVDVGNFIIAGTLLSIPLIGICYFLSKKLNNSVYIHTMDNIAPANENLPPVFYSFLPILMPLTLITCRSFYELSTGQKIPFITLAGEPAFALCIGMLCALPLAKKNIINSILTDSIEKAGPILAVVSAGGAFGGIIKATGVGALAGEYISHLGLGIWIPFIMASFLKVAQGSSTVAIITASSIIQPMLGGMGMSSGAGSIFCVLSLGLGSMAVSHANDAFFWVICNFSGMNSEQALKYYTPITGAVAISGMIILQLAYLF